CLEDCGRTGRDEINRCQLGSSNRSTRKNDNKKDAAKNCSPTHLSFSSLALCYLSDMAAQPVQSRSFFLAALRPTADRLSISLYPSLISIVPSPTQKIFLRRLLTTNILNNL